MADFYNSMGPLAVLALMGLTKKKKRRGAAASLIEPSDPRTEKQDLGLGFQFRSAGADPRGKRTLKPKEERMAEASKRREKFVEARTKRQEAAQEVKPEIQRLQKREAELRRERRAAIERDKKRKARKDALDNEQFSGLLS